MSTFVRLLRCKGIAEHDLSGMAQDCYLMDMESDETESESIKEGEAYGGNDYNHNHIVDSVFMSA